MDANRWTTETCQRLDALDVDGFLEQLSDDVWVRLGNARPVSGTAAVREGLEQLFQHLRETSHMVHHVSVDDDRVGLDTTIVWTLTDGTKIRTPAYYTFRLRDGKADRLQLFADLHPVFGDDDGMSLWSAEERPTGRVDLNLDGTFPASDPPSWSPGHA